jgi:hypothetical protein
MRRAAKIDTVQPAIVEALKKIGATVQSLGQVGSGCPDLLVGYMGRSNILLEVKTGNEQPNAGQLAWHQKWAGQVSVVRSAEEATLEVIRIATELDAVGQLREFLRVK